MHLTFLNPVPALIAAAVTVPALLLLYFLKLRRRPVRVSSTLLWQQATRDLQVNVPFRLIHPTWLLFLQLLILVLFLLALARPAVNMRAGTPERVVLVIDRSASMNALDGAPGPNGAPSTRLEEAKSRARRMLDELSGANSGSSFAVVELAAAPRVAASLGHDTSTSRTALDAIQPSDQPGELAGALRLAGAMLAGEASESARERPGTVMLFSDGSFPPATEGFTLAGAEFRYQRVGPVITPGVSRPRDNLGIVSFSAQRDWNDPAVVRLFVRVRNAGSGPVAAPLVLSLDGAEIERKPVEVPGAAPPPTPQEASSQEPVAAVAPSGSAEATATFQLSRRDGGILTVAIDRPDLLDADNSASLVLEAATKPRILVVIPDPPARAPGDSDPAPPKTPEWLITDVVRELKLPMRITPASAFQHDTAETPGSGSAPLNADLLIFDRVTPARLPATPSLSFGAGLPAAGVTLAAPAPSASGTYILSWQRTHPLLQHVALDSVFIARPMTAAPATPAIPNLTELARGTSGPLIQLLEDRAARHVVVDFELAYSNWPLTPGFSIFLAQTIDYLTLRAQDRAGRAFATAEPVEITVPPNTARVTLSGPQRLERTLGEGDPTPAGLRRVSLGLFDRAGVYRVDGAAASDDPASPTAAVAVNLLDATETSIDVADRLRVAGVAVPGSGPGDEPAELWPYLIAAALILLTLEWFLNAFLMKV